MKNYFTLGHIFFYALVIGIVLQVIVIFFPNKKNDMAIDVLTRQQKQIEQLTKQLQKLDDENRKRDSVLLDAFEKNSAQRNAQLSQTKKTANEKIDHINGPSFNSDSIRRAFANN